MNGDACVPRLCNVDPYSCIDGVEGLGQGHENMHRYGLAIRLLSKPLQRWACDEALSTQANVFLLLI